MVTIGLWTDLVDFGWSEGSQVAGEVAMVVAEFGDGKRLADPMRFHLYRREWDEDGFIHAVPNPIEQRNAKARLTLVRDRLAAGTLKFDGWEEIEPVYGSDRYHRNWRRWETED